MRFLRLRYIIPASFAVIFGIIFVAYASIMWDEDDSSIWYGPNNAPYVDNIASWSTDGNWDESYTCPVIPPKEPPPVDGVPGDGVPGDGGPPPPPPPPPPVVGPVTDSF